MNEEQLELYRDGKAPEVYWSTEEGRFGEYFVSDTPALRLALSRFNKLAKNHPRWVAKKIARKVAEELKLKKFPIINNDAIIPCTIHQKKLKNAQYVGGDVDTNFGVQK